MSFKQFFINNFEAVIISVVLVICFCGTVVNSIQIHRNRLSIDNIETEISSICNQLSKQNEQILKRIESLDTHLSIFDKYASEHFNFFYNPNTVHIVEKDKRSSKTINNDVTKNNNQSLIKK
ncbi:hypothetical protein [Capybara microvirus Cap3_SP_386]|nr:hypothetical protein [Capybara microvirus Cap3_SP_386]